jgi:2-C-methyl-D-erythritol 4-phosphate cytidylyltransferase
MNNSNVLVILAGGSGTRYKANVPKQYSLINGKELLEYSIDEMSKSVNTDKLLVILDNNAENIKRVINDYHVEVTVGGKDRSHSFQNALDYIKSKYPTCKKVIFHEAARPLVHYDVIDRYFDLLDEYDYVESCQHIADSLGSYVVQAPRREDYYLIQAPEAYKFSVLNQYYNCNSDIYFAANQFPSFIKGYQNFDIKNNIKLTNPEDRALIEYLLAKQG